MVGGLGGTSSAPPPGLLDAFRKSDFNVAAFVRDATGQGQERLGRLTQQLEDSASSLDDELQREIIACHEELLQSAGSVNDLDGQLGDVREVVEALKVSIMRMRTEVLSPFGGVRRRTELLERMQAVTVLIRKLQRFLFAARKLRTQMEAPSKDYSKAAQTLQELEAVLAEGDLERVDALRAEVAWIRDIGARIRRQAEEDLRSGTRQGNQISLSVALQVFFNIQTLRPQLLRLLAEMLEEFAHTHLVTGANFQQSLEVNLQLLVAQTQRVYLLDELIRGKTDPLTQRTFSTALEEGEGVASLVGHFWCEATGCLKTKFSKLSNERTARKAMIADFPKVLNALLDAADKVNMMSRGRGQALRGAERDALCAAVGDLRSEFLQESIRRVTEPVEMMLPDRLLASLSAVGERFGVGAQGAIAAAGGAGDASATDELPTSHDIRRYVQLLSVELERCECCPEQLLKEAVRNVRGSVLLFATRLEQVVDGSCVEVRFFDDEARLKLRSPLPLPAAGHARNARLFGIAHHTLAALKEAMPTRFQGAVVTEQVQATLQQTQQAIVSPMLEALRRCMRTSFLLQQAGGAERNADGSLPLIAVGQACAHVSRYYFALFGVGQLLPYLKDLIVSLIRFFLSAAVLSKPHNEATRNELLQDMQTFEAALSALEAEYQGHVQRETNALKEFRNILLAKSLEALDFEELAKVIPVHILLVYLVHTLPPEVPSLPVFCKASPEAFLMETLYPLWDGEPAAIAAFKTNVAELADRHDLDPTESPAAAFILAQSA